MSRRLRQRALAEVRKQTMMLVDTSDSPALPAATATAHDPACQLAATARLDPTCERCRAILAIAGS